MSIALEFDLICIAANKTLIPNYGDRYRNGETISTAFVESAVNQVVRASTYLISQHNIVYTTEMFSICTVNSNQFKRWLAKQGCTFESKPGGSGHLIAKLGNKKTELPMHGGKKQLGKGLIEEIKKRLGL